MLPMQCQRMKKKNGFVGAIVLAIIIFGGVILGFSCTSRVPTPSRTGAAYTVATGDICIDSACVYGGKLCALAINEDGNSKLFYADKSEEDDENLQGIS